MLGSAVERVRSKSARARSMSLPTKLHSLRAMGTRRQFQRKVHVEFSSRHYRVKTIDSMEDFLKVLELRHRVFQKEFAGKRFCIRSDRDKYDQHADFLVVEDTNTNDIVGCYRLICSDYSSEFYSSSEFEIADLRAKPETKVELSRAAILKDYRNGRVINLLWRGIATYMKATNAGFLFGCGSIQTLDADEIRAYSRMFRDSKIAMEGNLYTARKKYRLEDAAAETDIQVGVELPPLLRAYVRAGARVCSEPALDRKFKCTDFLIVLESQHIDRSFRERYIGN